MFFVQRHVFVSRREAGICPVNRCNYSASPVLAGRGARVPSSCPSGHLYQAFDIDDGQARHARAAKNAALEQASPPDFGESALACSNKSAHAPTRLRTLQKARGCTTCPGPRCDLLPHTSLSDLVQIERLMRRPAASGRPKRQDLRISQSRFAAKSAG
jgi:hypothetical protein